MKTVTFPAEEVTTAHSLLLSGHRFEVLAEARSHDDRFAAFVLGRFGWSWGHFFRAAFCTLSQGTLNHVSLSISYLDAQRPWHGRNLFRASDQAIEHKIATYALAAIRGARLA